jgi:hypothetical protein
LRELEGGHSAVLEVGLIAAAAAAAAAAVVVVAVEPLVSMEPVATHIA